MSNKLLIFTSSLIATSGIGGLGIMLYQKLLSSPPKSQKSITKKIQKTTTSAKKSQFSIPKLNKEGKVVLEVKDINNNTQKSKNPSTESTITFSSEIPTTIGSNLQDNSPDFSEEDTDNEDYSEEEEECIYEDLEEDEDEDCFADNNEENNKDNVAILIIK